MKKSKVATRKSSRFSVQSTFYIIENKRRTFGRLDVVQYDPLPWQRAHEAFFLKQPRGGGDCFPKMPHGQPDRIAPARAVGVDSMELYFHLVTFTERFVESQIASWRLNSEGHMCSAASGARGMMFGGAVAEARTLEAGGCAGCHDEEGHTLAQAWVGQRQVWKTKIPAAVSSATHHVLGSNTCRGELAAQTVGRAGQE